MRDIVILSAGGRTLPVQPLREGYQAVVSDLLSDGSGRSSESGVMLRYPIRTGVFKLVLRFKGTETEIASVDSILSGFQQDITFLWRGEYVTRTFYPGDRTLTTNGETSELTVNLIEV